MREFNITDSPIEVFGVPFFKERHVLERLPECIREEVPSLKKLGKRVPGARVCFKTNSKSVGVKITLETLEVDKGMSLYSCQSANVLIGDRREPFFAGLVNPVDYEMKTFENIFSKSNYLEDITIFLPRNEQIADVKIYIEDTAEITVPTPYEYGPILFYGSSITEGGCCGRLTNAYNAILSNRLNFDYYNFGFSGAAMGEREIAEYINTIDIKAFVYDYDHNAPDTEHLEKTHEQFFKIIRKGKPDIPIVIMSRPNFYDFDDSKHRREIIYKTYKNAVASGDKNVYYIDGESFFGEKDRSFCTNDTIHPNDLGFYRMAEVIEPVMKQVLKNI